MNEITQILNCINNNFLTYILIVMLLGCAIWFSFKTHFVQFRYVKEMIRLLGDSTAKINGHEKHISSFEAFAISLASRVGTGNLAGVALAITVGGPGAIFWMWVIALLGASSAFVESTLAQLFKIRSKHSYIGGPAYYMEKGLKKRWMGITFAVLITVTFGFAFNSVQSNTMSAALHNAFHIDPLYSGIAISLLTLAIIFGGVHSIARVSSVIVPVMAIGYIILALFIIITNIYRLPEVIELIIGNAFGWHQALGGGIGAALMQGIKRGLFSNEAGMGSAPNAAATAHVTHPVKQGLIQALGVFTDTLLICSCTAFIILFSNLYGNNDMDGIELTQAALNSEVGSIGTIYVAVAILFFAYSSILGNYYYGEANIRFITKKQWTVNLYRILVGGMVLLGSLASLETVWSLADITMALMAICNLIAILLLGKYAFRLLDNYMEQKRNGIKSPSFYKEQMKDIEQDIECW
ncbi:alanine/glycine:cation symporter family protein [Bacteroides ilei]|uniref:alanine/glycine:cation symporter family protein n=1 Tax=Bacteroides ilei TaxID=1907658 RepID=UPI0009307DD3|nr:alanine/glycine:cation symporter family protein [Bacteroides ilei]